MREILLDRRLQDWGAPNPSRTRSVRCNRREEPGSSLAVSAQARSV